MPPPLPPHPGQGSLNFSSSAGARTLDRKALAEAAVGVPPLPNRSGANVPIHSHPAIHGIILQGLRYDMNNAEIAKQIKDRIGVAVRPADVGQYVFRLQQATRAMPAQSARAPQSP